jgi:hypothetical protein
MKPGHAAALLHIVAAAPVDHPKLKGNTVGAVVSDAAQVASLARARIGDTDDQALVRQYPKKKKDSIKIISCSPGLDWPSGGRF